MKKIGTQSESFYLARVEDELNDICTWAVFKSQTIVITGDLNLDRLRQECREGKIMKDLEEVHGLHGMINEPTRITPTSETILDVIMTNKLDLFRECASFVPGISDHHLVYGIMTQSAHRHRCKIIRFRSIKNVNVSQLKEDIGNAPWSTGEIFDSLDDQYEPWKALLENILDEHILKKKMRVRENDVPYMTADWKKAIKQKRKYAQIYARERTPKNWEQKRKWRNLATKETRRAIKTYWAKHSEELKRKPRDFYKTFKPFLSKKSCKDDVTISIKINERMESNPEVVAEEFGNYFSTMANVVGGEHVLDLEEQAFDNYPSIEAIRQAYQDLNLQFEFSEIENGAVEKELKNLNTSKASGWDDIPQKLLKLIAK